ncbi:response regulator [Candidatus Woesearchaeota archaeon]|nr:response regulator [Candidatus Woesearchaeota archaeon]
MKKKIMIVEDSSLMVVVINNFIKKSGLDVEVTSASSGEEAIRLYTQERPNLVFMDILMPDMDGITALEKIKEIDPNAKVVMCTSLREPCDEERARKAGCSGYIMKPFSSQDIRDALEENLK